MYDRILVAIDASPTEENRSAQARAEQIGRMTGATVYILHVAKSHIVPGDITGGAGLGVRSADDDAEDADRNAVQALVDQLCEAGVEAHGEIVSATTHDVASVILQRAKELNVDLLVLGHQHHRGASNVFRSSVADWIIHHHPPFSILLARPPATVQRVSPAST
jgi:nucleotide-binding universal stress UspA family protein